ncbi:uncharacterized protein LOC100897902 [Galendromus occidentalis]|uniref:Uncharacterized protein LOC100897902 n=1 Tax=Galendromus occidentalis TaxID=34638 RepID=A0AAJ6QXZ2_9ACAR|nr:uncharacterized protein LOC100897902 [Galendromus occidentalis]
MARPNVVVPLLLFITSVVWLSAQAGTDIPPCNPDTCEEQCNATASTYGENITLTHQCNKASGRCICCVLPECEATCQQRRKKERPRSKDVRSRCNDKGECYCNFIFFEDDTRPSSAPKLTV